MSRHLKTLGVALIAMLTLSAAVASLVPAQTTEKKLHSEIEDTTLTTTAINTQEFITGAGEAIRCKKLQVTSTVAINLATEIKAIPNYSECEAEAGGLKLNATVDINSCYYTFTADTEVESHHKFRGPMHIKCTTPGDSITVTVQFLGTQTCLHIPEQTPTTPTVDYTNEDVGGKRHFRMIFTVEGGSFTKTSVCGSGTSNNMVIVGESTFIGESAAGVQKGIWFT